MEAGDLLFRQDFSGGTSKMKTNSHRFLCALCALTVFISALFPASAFAAQAADTVAQTTLTTADAREMQQADSAVTALTGSNAYAEMTRAQRLAAAVAQLQQLAENKRVGTAAIYYAFDNTINSARYPYYAYMQTYWDSVGLQTRLDTTVTVSDLRRMGDYDLCILSTHGAYYTYEYGWLWKRTATEPLILLNEKSDFWSDLRYGFDLLAHRVVKVNGMYAVNGDFFRSAYRGNGIVLSETCEFYGKNGHVDTAMADGLLAGGAKAVMGYVNNVYSVYSRSMLWATVNRMIEGETLEQAVDYAKSIYGTDDIIWYNEQGGRRPHAAASYAMLSGSRSAVLPNPYTAEEAAAAA